MAETPKDSVDEASEESFPASDPPSWEPLHSGPPAAPDPDVSDPDDEGNSSDGAE